MKSFINSLECIKKSFWLLAVGLWLISTCQAFAQSERKFIREGNKSFDSKKYSDAEVAYKKSLGKNQKSYEGNFNLGDAYYKQGKYDEAAKQFELLESQKKDKASQAAAMHNLGNTLLQNQKYPESIEAYKQALKLNPKDEDTRYNLAYAQARLKQQQQQQQQQQNQDKNKEDKKDQKQQQQQQQQQKQEQAQQKQQQEQKKEISKEDAERILQALNNDEKDKHKKKAKVASSRVRVDKDW